MLPMLSHLHVQFSTCMHMHIIYILHVTHPPIFFDMRRESNLKGAFNRFVLDAINEFEKKCTDIRQFRRYVKMAFPESCSHWTKDSDYEDIVFAISKTHRWNHLHFDPLIKLLKAFNHIFKSTRKIYNAFIAEVTVYQASKRIYDWMRNL